MKDPVPEDGEVVLSVKGCGICHTDFKVIQGALPTSRQAVMPLVPGHEIVGVVENTGPGQRMAHWRQSCSLLLRRMWLLFLLPDGKGPPLLQLLPSDWF